jgi:hypothetical protein
MEGEDFTPLMALRDGEAGVDEVLLLVEKEVGSD